MNKKELTQAVSKKTKMAQKDAAEAIDAVIESIAEELEKGRKVQLVGFGTFETRERSARTGRNAQTGENMKIKAAVVPAFKPGKTLKERVNKG